MHFIHLTYIYSLGLNVLIGTATHTHMGFLINFNLNYLKHNVYYWLENLQHMIPLSYLSQDILLK